jgi:hypothetical protein
MHGGKYIATAAKRSLEFAATFTAKKHRRRAGIVARPDGGISRRHTKATKHTKNQAFVAFVRFVVFVS